MKARYLEVDFLRGLAVVLMIFFHFGYDLAYFGYASYKTTVDMEWIIFRLLIVSIFLLCVGMSVYLSHRNGIDWGKLRRRVLRLGAVSVLISLASYFVFPQAWIYFGVIHFITVASVLAIWFVGLPRLSLVLGIAVVLSYNMGYFRFDPLLDLAVTYLNFPRHTVDVVSFTPWFGVVLIGIYMMHKELFGWRLPSSGVTEKFSWAGRHALAIYLIHQPVLFVGFEIIRRAGV